MLTVYLARHGQDEDNMNGLLNGRRDQPLTVLGQQQAEALAEKIKAAQLGITKVYASPLQRAYRTGEVVADALELPKPEKHDLLAERDYGVMTGKPIKDIGALCAPHILQCNPILYFLEAEGAESWPSLLTRAETLLASLREKHADDTLLLVCHGDIGKMLYAAFYGLGWKETLQEFHFGNSEVLLLAQNSLPEERSVYKAEQFNH